MLEITHSLSFHSKCCFSRTAVLNWKHRHEKVCYLAGDVCLTKVKQPKAECRSSAGVFRLQAAEKCRLRVGWRSHGRGCSSTFSLPMCQILQPCKWPNTSKFDTVGNTAASLYEASFQCSGIKTGVRGAWGGWMDLTLCELRYVTSHTYLCHSLIFTPKYDQTK